MPMVSATPKMINSSLDDAILLLNKWKDESALIQVVFTKGDPFAPSFQFSLRGSVVAADTRGLRLSGGEGSLFINLDDGTEFRYLESPDVRPSLREMVKEAMTGCLSFSLHTGETCLLCALRTDPDAEDQ